MNIAKLPETLDRPKVEALRKAFGYFYDEGNAENFTDPATKIHFDEVSDFVDYLNSSEVGIPKGTSAKHIGITLERWYEILSDTTLTTTEAPKYEAPTTSNVPQAGLREQQAEKLETFEKAYTESKEEGIRQAQEFLDQQQKRADRLREILAKQKIYTKVEEKAPITELPKEQTDAINKLKEEAVQNQKAVAEQLAEEIKVRIAKDTPPEILDNVAKQTAIDTVQILAGEPETSPTTQIAYFQAIAKNPEVVEKIVKDPGIAKEVTQTAIDLTDFKTSQLEQSRKIFASAFSEGAANYVYAGKTAFISETAVPGYAPSSLSQIPEYYSQNLSDQSSLLSDVRGVGFDEARSQIGNRLGGLIDKRIAALPEGHFLRSEFASNTLGVFGVGPAVNWVAVEGASPVIKFAVSRGFGPVLGAVQSATGWKLGISKLAAPVVEKTATGIAGKAATKLGLGATITAAFAWTGPLAPIIGAVASFVVGDLIVKIGSKILSRLKSFINENKEVLFGLGALGMIFGGAPIRIISSLPLLAGGAAMLAAGTFSAVAIGLGIGRFFWFLGRSFAVTIGTPVVVTLLVFPVLVALILFIINSGAYVVPPSPLLISGGSTIISPYVDVTKTPVPPGPFQNSDLPLTVEYQIQIKAKKGTLQNVEIEYECNVVKENSSAQCPINSSIPSTVEEISPSQPYEFSYSQTYEKQNFQDSLIADTITITADVVEQQNVIAAASAGVKIGNPPDTCPSGWPVVGNRVITQTPGGGFTHSAIEAIDIGSTPPGTAIKATHSGVATVVRTSNAYRPLYIDIISNCGGKTITTRYAHLSGTSISNGQAVTMGQTIGSSGSDGTGPHLHYEFRGLRMELPYVPADEFRRNCSDDGGRCGTTGVKL